MGWFEVAWRSFAEKATHYLRKTTSRVWTSNMGTVFEKMCNHSKECVRPNYKTFGWILLFELCRKTRETESTLLVYRTAQDNITELSKDLHSYENCTLLENVWSWKRVSRKCDYQFSLQFSIHESSRGTE